MNSSVQKRLLITTTVLSEFERNIANMHIDKVRDFVLENINKQLNPTAVDFDAKAEIIDKTPKELKTLFLGTFGDTLVNRTKKIKKFGTAKWYEDGISAIKVYNKKQDILISNITISFLEDFEAEHISNGNSPNTISAYLRAIRSITNYAVKENLKGKNFEGYPWGKGGYSIPGQKTKKRAVKKDVITAIRELVIEKNKEPGLWRAQRYLLFIFNNRGVNFIDIAKFKKEQIIDSEYSNSLLIAGRFDYVRSKNGKDFSIKLTREAINILNDFDIFNKSTEDFVFPLGFENTETGNKTYRQKRKRINECFSELAKRAKFPGRITTVVIRHAWAMIAKLSGVSMAVIGEGLGHEEEKTTTIYLDHFENKVLDDANELIVGY